MVLVSKDSPLVTSRIQAITVIDVGRFFIKRILAPSAGLQLRRAISIRAEGKTLLERLLSRRQLQGFVGLRTPSGSCFLGSSFKIDAYSEQHERQRPQIITRQELHPGTVSE
jgi:hypothetical protein